MQNPLQQRCAGKEQAKVVPIIVFWFYNTDHWHLYCFYVLQALCKSLQELKISNSYKLSVQNISYNLCKFTYLLN